LAHELLPLDVVAYVPPFMQLQENILDKLHDHSIFKILLDMAFYSHHACLQSYAGSGVGGWLFVHLIIPSFCLASDVFFFSLHTKLGLPHPLVLK